MNTRRSASAGYSIIELLVVVAIIGVMSLVAVPAFMNFSNSNRIKTALTSFTGDIRNCRQRAITRNSQVRLELNSSNTYCFYEKPNGGSWGTLSQFSGSGPGSNTKTLDSGLTFSANTLIDSDSNSKNDVVFKPDGTVSAGTGSGCCTVTILSPWKKIANDQVVITLTSTGQIKSVPSHS